MTDQWPPPTEPRPPSELLQHLSAPSLELVAKTGNEPWLPTARESPGEYLAFFCWLEQKPRPPATHKLAVQNLWAARALAYDEYQAGIQQRPIDQTANAISESLMGTMHLAAHVVRGEMVKALTNSFRSPTGTVTLSELGKLVELLAKTSRLLSGQSTDNTSVKVDLRQHTQEEIDQIEALLLKGNTEP